MHSRIRWQRQETWCPPSGHRPHPGWLLLLPLETRRLLCSRVSPGPMKGADGLTETSPGTWPSSAPANPHSHPCSASRRKGAQGPPCFTKTDWKTEFSSYTNGTGPTSPLFVLLTIKMSKRELPFLKETVFVQAQLLTLTFLTAQTFRSLRHRPTNDQNSNSTKTASQATLSRSFH